MRAVDGSYLQHETDWCLLAGGRFVSPRNTYMMLVQSAEVVMNYLDPFPPPNYPPEQPLSPTSPPLPLVNDLDPPPTPPINAYPPETHRT